MGAGMRASLGGSCLFAAVAGMAPLVAAAQPEGANLSVTPQGFKVLNAWPVQAGVDIDQGTAVTRCIVNDAAKLINCAVVKEEPAGRGFGDMALKLTSKLSNTVRHAGEAVPTTFIFSRTETAPEWLRKPTLDQLLAVYPRAAGQKGASGMAVIKCTVNLEGLLRDCKVVEEKPAGLGFGPAAQVLAPTFLMKPATKNGRPVESEITIPINFKTYGAFTAADSEPVTIVSQTIWAQTPNTAEILALIDKKVGDKFADGKVVFQCDLNKKTGRMSGCNVANTSPGMAQFIGVARALVPKFQVSEEALTQYKDKVKINLAFAFPDMASPAWSQRYLTHPRWIRTVNPDPNLPVFPEEAAKAGLKTGSATVDCLVAPEGALTQCQVVSESTPGVGFGAMATRIAEAFVANPWNEDGLPVDGAHVKMPIRMNYDPAADAPSADPAPTPATKP